MTLNSMRQNRWQLVSDDHVWMYPADITLSTLELPKLTFDNGMNVYGDTPYESCIFFANGESEVLARYKTQAEAICGHIELEQQYKLKRISKSESKI